LGDVAYITDGEHGSPIFDEKSGIKYFSAQHVRDGFIDDSEAKNISKIIDEKNKRSRLQEGDVLLSTVGTIGFAGLVTEDLLPANIDRHVARIALKEKILDPHFLVAFLNSSFGRFQTVREATGNVQLNLFIDKIKELLVPKINNYEVSKMARNALQELKNSKNLYALAEDLLLEDLGLKNFKPEEKLSYIVNLSDVQSAYRADAEYFQPKYKKLLEKIKIAKGKLLGELASIKKGFEPGSEEYQNEGKLFIRVSNISKHGLIDKDQKYLSDGLYQKLKKDFGPMPGEILITKDATPGIAYVLKESVEGIIAGGIIRLKLKEDIEGEYLALCINSIIGQMQIERDSGGSVIAHWKPEQIKKLQVPSLPKSTQQKVTDLVHQSHQARKKAKELLEEAKQKIEKMILGVKN
jgi:type I restriction enzyme S subunit